MYAATAFTHVITHGDQKLTLGYLLQFLLHLNFP